MRTRELMRRPSAIVPFVLTAGAMALIAGHVIRHGSLGDPSGDEGTAARLFQLIMLVQLCFTGAFAVAWLPREPRSASIVLGLQIVAGAVPMVLVAWLERLAQ